MSLKCDIGTRAKFVPEYASYFDTKTMQGVITGIEREGDGKSPQTKRRILLEPNEFYPVPTEHVVSVKLLKQLS